MGPPKIEKIQFLNVFRGHKVCPKELELISDLKIFCIQNIRVKKLPNKFLVPKRFYVKQHFGPINFGAKICWVNKITESKRIQSQHFEPNFILDQNKF